ncbi:hypothetical protein ACQKP8_26725, partial [Photobacterium alginatilyticum]|uniref:hypothetical protein n=1 Tax=Photobacterium alginatilyticum TaxID=1775171 RepID=UPI0040687870
MKIKSAPVFVLILTTAGCGGGGSSDTKSDARLEVVNASVCFNETLFTVGTEYTLKTKEENNAVETTTYKVLDEKTFRGQPSIRVKQTDATS